MPGAAAGMRHLWLRGVAAQCRRRDRSFGSEFDAEGLVRDARLLSSFVSCHTSGALLGDHDHDLADNAAKRCAHTLSVRLHPQDPND